jgi:hypothetical protein
MRDFFSMPDQYLLNMMKHFREIIVDFTPGFYHEMLIEKLLLKGYCKILNSNLDQIEKDNLLEWHISTTEILKKYFIDKESIKKIQGIKIVLFGTSNAANRISKDLCANGLEIVYCIDNNQQKWGQEFCGRKIYEPSKLREDQDNCIVIIGSSYWKEIINQLENLNLENIKIGIVG